ncbi:MAG: stage III sporulation protein AE [Ruminococcus sp.]|nr:stage III sporulation protein AE [Ruminococcus sp.]
MLLSVFFTAVPAFAQSEEGPDLSRITEEINEKFMDTVDSDTYQVLEENGISAGDTEGVMGIDLRKIFSGLLLSFTEQLSEPFKLLSKLAAVSVICSVAGSVCTDQPGLNELFDTTAMLSVITVVSGSVSELFEKLKDALELIERFMISYIPIFSAVTAAGGRAVTAGCYSGATVLLCETVSFVSSNLLLPLLFSMTALTIVSAVGTDKRLSAAAEGIKKTVVWLLSTVTVIFVGVLSLQGLTGAAADGLAAKSVRLAASSFIPVIGGSVSEAYSAVMGGMGVIRTTLGTVGMIALAVMALRPLLLIIAMRLVLFMARLINDMLCASRVSELLKGLDQVLGLGMSIIITAAAAFLVSTAAIMFVSGGGF